jgi:hypothetical protein
MPRAASRLAASGRNSPVVRLWKRFICVGTRSIGPAADLQSVGQQPKIVVLPRWVLEEAVMRWQDYISVDPAITHGKACIRGTRIPVAIIHSYPT